MVDHLKYATLNALCVERKQTQHDEAKVAHRGISHQLLDVFLCIRDCSTIQDANGRQPCYPRSQLHRCTGKHGEIKPEEAVSTNFQQHTCQDHRTSCRGFDVCIRQPGM